MKIQHSAGYACLDATRDHLGDVVKIQVRHWHGPTLKTNELYKLVQEAMQQFEALYDNDIKEIY